MNKQQEYISYLFKKCARKEATEAELDILFNYISDPANEEEGIDLLCRQMNDFAAPPEDIGYWKEKLEKKASAIVSPQARSGGSRRFLPRAGRWMAAAAILTLLIAGAYQWTNSGKKQPVVSLSRTADIPPGADGAVLTLADGTTVVLDSLGNGMVATQNGTRLLLSGGHLAYDARNAEEVSYNTISTPRGRQFLVVLPDGSSVWLNAGSSLRYPTAFTGKDRIVAMSGEAYFEIASDKTKPFRVQINGQTTVDVLGTSFNVNAYTDEELCKTTLLEGAVKINRQRENEPTVHSAILLPGQQAQTLLMPETGDIQPADIIRTVAADVDKVMAWRRGFFNFDDAQLDEVMRELARWYDLEVEYKGKVPAIVFGGELSKNVHLSGALKALEDSKVHFTLQGRKITVFP